MVLFGLIASPVVAGTLFSSAEVLALTLQGPLPEMIKDRNTEEIYSPATVTYDIDDGHVQLPVGLQVRGKSRLSGNTCAFPPLRLIVNKKQASGTIFEKQKKLKLVTQCYPRHKTYEQYVLTEYLIYKSFNLLTPNSYQVRLARINYLDESDQELYANYGFILEATKKIAKRIDRKRLKIDKTDATTLNGEHLNLVSLFQFMLGNTDWSATHGGNEECCHNGKLFGEPKGKDNLYIPYDFDMTGLVDPEYARTPPAMKLKNIRDRRYRGYCRNNDYLKKNIERFNQRKDEIINLFQDSEYLMKGVKRKKVAYIEKFYRIINDPARVERHIKNWCHKSEMIHG